MQLTKNLIKSAFIIVILLVSNTILLSCSQSEMKPDIRILWTNDTHGYLSPLYHREEGDDKYTERARREGSIGGFAYIATIVKQQRSQYPDRTVLFDSGDTWHGTVVPIRLSGTPVVEVMNAMGYDAMVPGNVEFFYSEEILESLFSTAKFPIVIANLYDTSWGERAELPNTQPYILIEINNLKVGVVGMTYHWMSKISDHPQWSFGLRIEEVQSDIDFLRQTENVDLVIVLSHMGWEVDKKFAELVSGIDIIIGAHTHDTLYKPSIVFNKTSSKDVIVVQSGSHGKYVGQIDLKIANKQVVAFEQTLIPVRTSKVDADPEISELIEQYRKPYKKELERVIGVTTTLIYRQGTWQSPADNLIADAIRQRSGQQVAVTEPGRYGATILPGEITVEDIYNLVPMELPVYYMKFSGSDLRSMFENAIDNVVSDNVLERVGSNMWKFSGLELIVDLTKPYPNRIVSIKVNGSPIKDDELYSLAEFNMFLRNAPTAVDVEKTSQIGPHEIIAYIEEQQSVSPALDNRIINHHGDIMSDHGHLHETWEQTGRNEFDLDKSELIMYRGKLGNNNRIKLYN